MTSVGPAKIWVGLRNSDDVGTRVDLLAEVFADTSKVAEGRVNNVATGRSGFNNAIPQSIPLSLLSHDTVIPHGSSVKLSVSVRRTCSGPGHVSGTPRLWYNGQPTDSGSRRDAGSRLPIVLDSAAKTYFLRTGLLLGPTAGAAKSSIEVFVDSKTACPDRPFKPFGTWSVTLP